MTSHRPREARERPCATCPYRRDVPAGVWDPTEYAKLASYDGETAHQSPAAFLCHHDADVDQKRLCAGWLGCHDPQELLAVRLGIVEGTIDGAVFDFETDVPLFSSGAEAARHGLSGVPSPDEQGRRAIAALEAQRAARRARRQRADDVK